MAGFLKRLIGKVEEIVNLPIPDQREEEEYIEEVIIDSADYIVDRLYEVTAPFVTDFEFVIDKTGEWEYSVRPRLTEIERTTATGGTVSSWVLFNTLDKGSEGAKLVLLPNDFENETSPNSLGTRSADYDRQGIVAIPSKLGQDMEARNWTDLIAEEYNNRFTRTREVEKKVTKRWFNLFGQ